MKWSSVDWLLSHWSRVSDSKTAESGGTAANSGSREASVSGWAGSGVSRLVAFSNLVGGGADSSS